VHGKKKKNPHVDEIGCKKCGIVQIYEGPIGQNYEKDVWAKKKTPHQTKKETGRNSPN
jgi:hypothetical protein